jgi:hypothetical protein
MSKAYDDAPDRVRQNGEAIRPEQGIRRACSCPGWEGNASVKVGCGDRDLGSPVHDARGNVEVHRSDGRRHRAHLQLPDGRALAHHVSRLPGDARRGWVEINGIAWTGSGKIRRVDVSTDGGATWTPAKLQEPVLSKAHTRFRHLWNWTGGEAVIMSRAVDETGYVQPTKDDADRLARRQQRRLPHNPITGWHVRPDGTVVYRRSPGTMNRLRSHRRVAVARLHAPVSALVRAIGGCRSRRRRRGEAGANGAAKGPRPSASASRHARGDRRAGHRRRTRRRRPAAGRGTAADGAPIYAARCAGCHGKTGKEGPNDVLVGRLPATRFRSRRIRARPRPSAATGRMRPRCSTTSAGRCRPTHRDR